MKRRLGGIALLGLLSLLCSRDVRAEGSHGSGSGAFGITGRPVAPQSSSKRLSDLVNACLTGRVALGGNNGGIGFGQGPGNAFPPVDPTGGVGAGLPPTGATGGGAPPTGSSASDFPAFVGAVCSRCHGSQAGPLTANADLSVTKGGRKFTIPQILAAMNRVPAMQGLPQQVKDQLRAFSNAAP